MDTSSVDLLNLIGRDVILKWKASTNGGEYAGLCPFCQVGKDRFRVWPHPPTGNPRFWCRRCNEAGDAITYMQWKHPGMSFAQICDELGLQQSHFAPRRPVERRIRLRPLQHFSAPLSQEPESLALTDSAWQEAATHFVRTSFERLWKPSHQQARQYLNGRGLTEAILSAASFGDNPTGHHAWWGKTKVWLPQGTVIPWWIDGKLWRINIRRPVSSADDNKYMQPKGGANGLYRADAIYPGCTLIMTEGEIDTLSILTCPEDFQQQHQLVPVATGSASGSHLLRWVLLIALADRVLLAFDADDAGDEAALWWGEKIGRKARRLRPTAHDVNDMLRGGEDLSGWIASTL